MTRVALFAVGAAILIVLLFTVVFPWVDRTFVNDPVLEPQSTSATDRGGAAPLDSRWSSQGI